MDERFGKLLALALEETESIEEATVAAALAYEMPVAPVLPKPLAADFALDIFDTRAQGILNAAMKVARHLSAQARRDLAAALKLNPDAALHAIAQFLDRYRMDMARLLSATELAAALRGMSEVAKNIPRIPPMGMDYPPPSLGPVAAVELVHRLRNMEGMAREEAIYQLTPTEQRYVRQAMGVEDAPPPPLRLPAPSQDAPEAIQWPVIEEAAQLLANKNVVDRAEFDRLDAAARQKAFTITGIDNRDALARIRDLLSQSVAEGPDYATFRKEALAAVDEARLLSESHLEQVFRNATQAAFADGQMKIVSHPFVRSGFPYAARYTIHDDRQRVEHGLMEKYGIQATNVYRVDDPVWQRFRSPWAYNCRCNDTFLTIRQAADRGIEEALTWLRTGVEPEQKAWVTPPPFAPPPGFDRQLDGMPLSIQLSAVAAAEMVEEGGSEDEYFTGMPSFDPPEKWVKPPKPKKAVKAKKRRKGRRLNKRSRAPDEWRVLSGGMMFSTESPGPGWTSVGAGKWVRGVMFGLVGDEWHGPNPPGPDWVLAGYGARGGKVWRHKGHIGKQHPANQTESVQKALAAFPEGADIKTLAKFTRLTPNQVTDELVKLRDAGQLQMQGTKYHIRSEQTQQPIAPLQSASDRRHEIAQQVDNHPVISAAVGSSPLETAAQKGILGQREAATAADENEPVPDRIKALASADTLNLDAIYRQIGLSHNEWLRRAEVMWYQYGERAQQGDKAFRDRLNAGLDNSAKRIQEMLIPALQKHGYADLADFYTTSADLIESFKVT